jgi:hypothetical protein
LSEFVPPHERIPEQLVAEDAIVLAREVVGKDAIELRAQELIDARHEYAWEHIDGEDYYNAVTSLFEELRAAGDVTEIDFAGDQAEIHAATIARLLNAYNPSLPKWELKRRFAEICEELTVFEAFCMIARGVLPADTQIVTASDFPSDSGEDLQTIHNAGYTAANRKGMLRSYSFYKNEDGEWVRHLEQISRSNADTQTTTRQWFNAHATAVPLHATGALHEQFFANRKRLPDGVVSYVAELDGMSEEPLLYGEPEHIALQNERPSYAEARDKSLADRQREHRYVLELQQYEKELTRRLQNGEIDYDTKLHLFHRRQDSIVDRILVQRPYMAADARGVESAKYYLLAQQAAIAGDQYAMNMYRSFAHRSRDRLSGGSCGGSGKNSDGNDIFDPIAAVYTLAQFNEDKTADEDPSKWVWKKGYCRVTSCSNKGKKTEVGPCSVCRQCQHKFDTNDDPTKKKSTENEIIATMDKVDSKPKSILAWLGVEQNEFTTAA